MNNSYGDFIKVIERLKEYHYYIEDSEVEDLWKCYSFLKEHFAKNGECREHSLDRSISVAHFIASWRFDIYVTTAALFHDWPESDLQQLDCLQINTAQDILRGYLHIRDDFEAKALNINAERSDKRNILTDNENISPQLFYIVIAARIDLLSRYKLENSEMAYYLAQSTREFLIPQIKAIHAYHLVDMLEELCFQIENRKLYDAIASIVLENDMLNDYFRQQSLRKLKQIFDKDSNIVPKKLEEERSRILAFMVEKRSIVSLQRLGIQNASSFEFDLESDLSRIADKNQTAYINLTLLLKNDDAGNYTSNVHDLFLKYYSVLLKEEGFFLRGYYSTTDKNSFYFVMSDKMQNLYRLFIKTENEYLRYFYGDIISKDNVGTDYIPRQSENKIKVFKPDGTAVRVDSDITALDFAFLVHENIGLHFDGGEINRNGKPVYPYTILNNGDTVQIKTNKAITAELNWFRYVKTDHALNKLIRYFKYNQPKRDQFPEYIKVQTLDGTFGSIEANTTVLDLAFMIHPDVGLRFESAIVNGKKAPINYILNDQDSVIIKKARQIKASISWFRHVNNKKSVDELIKYFRNNATGDAKFLIK